MAYNAAHWGTINAGQSYLVGYYVNGGRDQGAQFAQGNPENPGGHLVSNDHEIRRDDNTIMYVFRLTNHGANTSYTLAGGGLS